MNEEPTFFKHKLLSRLMNDIGNYKFLDFFTSFIYNNDTISSKIYKPLLYKSNSSKALQTFFKKSKRKGSLFKDSLIT